MKLVFDMQSLQKLLQRPFERCYLKNFNLNVIRTHMKSSISSFIKMAYSYQSCQRFFPLVTCLCFRYAIKFYHNNYQINYYNALT